MPHRGVNAGKSRLATVLDDLARARLNRWLLARTLSTVGDWLGEAQRCVVISPCEVTLALARKAGAVALPERVSTVGLNDALLQAAAYAADMGAQRLLILPCDLPRLDVAALQALEAVPASGNDVVIAPDRHYEGTNAMLVDATERLFSFGAGSYARHIAQGNMCGARTTACVQATLAFDLDTAEDLAAWVQSGDVPQEILAVLPRTPRSLRPTGTVSSRTK